MNAFVEIARNKWNF